LGVRKCERNAALDGRTLSVNARQRVTIAGADLAQQFLGLFTELLERWTRGQRRDGARHEISFHERPRPHDGLKERSALCLRTTQVGSALSADGVRPVTQAGTYSRQRGASIRGHAIPVNSAIPRERRR